MGQFDTFADVTKQLKTEGETIRLTFNQGQPAIGQGTVSWNVPTPALSCSDGTPEGVYSGMLILLSTKPLDASNIPVNGTVYMPDPTADFDLHVGDRIGDALVVGAIYECEKRGTITPFTTSLVIAGLQPNTPYYVGGYATDCQFRYHSDGVRAYSDMFGRPDQDNVPARQIIKIAADGSTCITPTDGTGLIAGTTYEFDVIIDETYPKGTDVKTANISIDGFDAGTYQQLVDAINTQLLLIDNPQQSPIAPNTGALMWDSATKSLYQFDGTDHNLIDVIVESTDPTNVVAGEYWYEPVSKELQVYSGSPGTWISENYTINTYDPTNPPAGEIWFDSANARIWKNGSWCDLNTYVSATDPDICLTPTIGWYWFDTVTSGMYQWSTTNDRWEATSAISWPVAPNQLLSGTYWFDLATSHIYQYLGSPLAWSDLTSTVTISDTVPLILVDLMLWYNPSTEELQQYDATGQVWNPLDVLVWSGDPTSPSSCQLWWRTTDDKLFVWEPVHSEWDEATTFYMSAVDPLAPNPLPIDSIWYEPTSKVMKKYDGTSWFAVSQFIYSLTDPKLQPAGLIWVDPTTMTWKVLSGSPTLAWVEFDPIDSKTDPTTLATGLYWFDTSTNSLFVRNGLSWIVVTYSTTPYTPARFTQWFNSSSNILYEWSGSAWVTATPIATAYFNDCGITFETNQRGSSTVIIIPSPSTAYSTGVCYGTGYADPNDGGLLSQDGACSYNGSLGTIGYPARLIPAATFLWANVTPTSLIYAPQEGADGLSGQPSWEEIGVGTDGTPDERREMMDSIRSQLGYPVVEVELTQHQLDTAVNKALRVFREKSSSAYKRGFFFLDIEPQQQNYLLTNKRIGYNRINNVTSAHRFTSAFLSTAHGGGVYGQVVLQHLYNMGTYDLTSYHLVSQYIEQLEILFATRLVFSWNKNSRTLGFHQSFTRKERVLLDCSVERTEQDLLTDNITRPWIEQWALAESMIILAQIRGKYATLPGAGGSVTLNASDLLSSAESYKESLLTELEDNVAQEPEDYGVASTFIIG